MPHSPKIILVDDHRLVAEAIAKFFNESDFDVPAIFQDPKEALSKIPAINPDIILVDLDMPGMNGFELIQRLREHNLQSKYILLTMHLDQPTVKKAMSLSLSGYLPKNSNHSEFLFCVQSIRNGGSYFSQKALEVFTEKAQTITHKKGSKTSSLTPRESEILKLIAEGLSTKEIAEKLYIAVRTVETHRKAILDKLNVTNVAGMVRIAVKEGLVD